MAQTANESAEMWSLIVKEQIYIFSKHYISPCDFECPIAGLAPKKQGDTRKSVCASSLPTEGPSAVKP